MWFLAGLYLDDPTYNQSRAYQLMGEIDLDALDRSVRYIAGRHQFSAQATRWSMTSRSRLYTKTLLPKSNVLTSRGSLESAG